MQGQHLGIKVDLEIHVLEATDFESPSLDSSTCFTYRRRHPDRDKEFVQSNLSVGVNHSFWEVHSCNIIWLTAFAHFTLKITKCANCSFSRMEVLDDLKR